MATDTNQLNNTERNNTITLEESQGNTLVVIDPRVDDYQMLARGVRKGVKVLILDDNSDGVEQITQALADYPTESLQVVCHGAPGCLYLGKTPLDRENLSRYSQQLMEWGVADIGLYACNVAADGEFMLRLHQLTGANIAASAQRVGNGGKGGSWQLEYILGQMKSGLAFEPAVVREYPGVFVSFANAMHFPIGGNPQGIAVGDFDGDNNLDLVAANGVRPEHIQVLFGNGNGIFDNSIDIELGERPVDVTVGDFNKDGNLDIVVSQSESNITSIDNDNISVLLNNGNGNFADAIQFEAGIFPLGLAVADFNEDDNLDIAVANILSNNVSVFLGNGNGGFADATSFDTEGGDTLAVGDFNKDGNLDIVMTGNGEFYISVLFGNGDGSFADFISIDLGNKEARSFAVGDFNEDGNLDIVLGVEERVFEGSEFLGSESSVLILLGNEDGNFADFTEFVIAGPDELIVDVAVGDLDGDNNLDIAAIPRENLGSGSVSVLLGNGDGDFADAINFGVETGLTPEASRVSIAIADLNKDGKLDLAVTNAGITGPRESVAVLLNTTEIELPLPTVGFSQAAYQISEDGSVEGVAITIDRTGDTSSTSNVEVELSNGTATGGIDFDNTTIPIEFATGETSAVINIPINDDDLVEGTENFNLTLVNATEATIGPQNTAIVSIIDNDTPPVNLDIDGNGDTDALTDGLLALKYLFGSTGAALINNSIGLNAQRTTAAEIIAYLDEARSTMLDVDGNGSADALTDGLLILKYLFGSTGEALISGAIGDDATRTNASDIINYLQSFDL